MAIFYDYMINTNNRYRPQDEEDMLNEKVFGAFCENSGKIDSINAGDTVFLYKSKVGIVAYGTASGIVFVKDRVKPENGEFVANGSHYQKFTDFKKLAVPLAVREIESLLGRSMSFIHTIFKLRKGEGAKIIKHLEENN